MLVGIAVDRCRNTITNLTRADQMVNRGAISNRTPPQLQYAIMLPRKISKLPHPDSGRIKDDEKTGIKDSNYCQTTERTIKQFDQLRIGIITSP